jgi:hypothetical protein
VAQRTNERLHRLPAVASARARLHLTPRARFTSSNRTGGWAFDLTAVSIARIAIQVMQTRSDLTEKAASDKEVLHARNQSRDASSRPGPADKKQDQAAATAEFERLRARLRQLVGTTNSSR